MDGASEFGFELRTCRWAEREWEPAGERTVLVARQLGTKRRRWDTIVLECDPNGLRERARFGPDRLDGDLLDVVRHAPEEWAYYRDALPHPGYPWRYVRKAIHRAADREILETRKEGNRIEIRRKWPYPDWLDRLVAIENKPDLKASAARVLGDQLEHDVALALADEVWVATRRTGKSVEPALLEDLPVEVGILALDPERLSAEVAWHPRTLSVAEPGTRIVERPTGGRGDASAARFEYVPGEEKEETRLEIAERAYERGWRSYIDSMRPDCRGFELRPAGAGSELLRPHCTVKTCEQTASECAGSCPGFEPEPPAWRGRGWPIEGGPGKGCRRLLDERRRRRRPGL